MQAYLDGVNAYIASGELPFEYRLINAEPQPFDLHDVYCATGFMSYSFAIHLKTEPILDWMANHLDSALIADVYWNEDGYQRIPTGRICPRHLWPGQPQGARAGRPPPRAPVVGVQCVGAERRPHSVRKGALLQRRPHGLRVAVGVVRSARGRDPFGPELEYYGNHIGGLPFPVIGHTRDHAWGMTMFVNDDIDLFRETIEGDTYYHNGKSGFPGSTSAPKPWRWPERRP